MKRKATPISKSSRQTDDSASANIVARSELMLAIASVIKERGWTQAQAAATLGVAQPRISDLIQGRVDRFTVDMLMIWLQKLGKDASVQVRDNIFASDGKVKLTLFVCGAPDKRLLDNVLSLFGGDPDRFDLEIVDVLQHPERAHSERISATPSLVKISPLPRVVLTGDLSAASVRWQLAVAERESMSDRAVAMDLRSAAQEKREKAQDAREEAQSQRQRSQDQREQTLLNREEQYRNKK